MFPKLKFRTLFYDDAVAIASWRYEEPYSVYNMDEQAIARLLNPDFHYHAILRDEDLAGFYCLGEDARVRGLNYDDSAIDLGMGVRPDLTGRGQGKFFLMQTLENFRDLHPHASVRATIAAWNRRAIRMCEKAGFRDVTFPPTKAEKRPPQPEWIILLRPPEPK